jgi:hypothetical protein
MDGMATLLDTFCVGAQGGSWVYGSSQPLSLTLWFGEIPWFGVREEIQSCDWSKTRFLYVPNMIQVMGSFKPITALYFPPYIKPRNVAEQQCERQWLTSPRFSPQVLVYNSGFRDPALQFIRV